MARKVKTTPTTATPTEATTANTGPLMNSFGDAIGLGSNNAFNFPQNQGRPSTEQLSNANTLFKNLRWYFVSDFQQMLAELYVEIGLVQTIVDVPVDDGMRGGVQIKSSQLDEDQIEELQTTLERDGDLATVGQAAKWNRLFGGAGVLVLTDQDPESPLQLDAIGPDSAVEFRAVDMWELMWTKQNSTAAEIGLDVSKAEDFEHYTYYGLKIHKSRVMRMQGIAAPSFVRPRLRGWGFSVCEVLVRSINQYLKATDLGFEVLDEFKLDVYKMKNLVNTLLSPNGKEKIRERVQLANWQKNYQNAVVMDSEDDFDHKQLSFAGLAEAMAGIRMQVASDLRMPITKLFGQSVSAGMGNTDQNDMENYNSMVESQIRSKIKPDILRVCEIKAQQLFGFIPDDLSVTFLPLRVLTSEQEENVKNSKFNRALQAKQAGEISTFEFREICNKGDLLDITLDTKGDTLNPDDPEVQDIVDGVREGDTESDEGEEPDEEDGGDDEPKQRMRNADAWDEGKHPRAGDGKFGKGGGGSTGKKPETVFKEKFGGTGGVGEFHAGDLPRDEALIEAKRLRKDGVHATIWHIEGPKTGPKSKYVVAVPTSEKKSEAGKEGVKKKSAPIERHRLASTPDEVKSLLKSSKPQFDDLKKASPKLAESVFEWSRASYQYARSIQQNKPVSSEEKALGESVLKEFEKGFQELPEFAGPLTRDLSIEIDDALEMFKPGESFTTDAYTSFTAKEAYGRRKCRIVVEDSSAGRAVWGLCQNDDEAEVIVPKGVTYMVDRIEEQDDAPYVVIHVKELKNG